MVMVIIVICYFMIREGENLSVILFSGPASFSGLNIVQRPKACVGWCSGGGGSGSSARPDSACLVPVRLSLRLIRARSWAGACWSTSSPGAESDPLPVRPRIQQRSSPLEGRSRPAPHRFSHAPSAFPELSPRTGSYQIHSQI